MPLPRRNFTPSMHAKAELRGITDATRGTLILRLEQLGFRAAKLRRLVAGCGADQIEAGFAALAAEVAELARLAARLGLAEGMLESVWKVEAVTEQLEEKE